MGTKHFLIIHGTHGSPEGNWFPWLRHELEQRGHTVSLPTFPTPNNQSFETWLEVAQRELVGHDPADTVLIGHSIGAAFALRLAEIVGQPYAAIFAVCPFVCPTNDPDYDALNRSFVDHTFDWPMIRRGAKCWALFAGDNDPYVSYEAALHVAVNLGKQLEIIKGGGHLNAAFGYTRFDALLKAIDTNLNEQTA